MKCLVVKHSLADRNTSPDTRPFVADRNCASLHDENDVAFLHKTAHKQRLVWIIIQHTPMLSSQTFCRKKLIFFITECIAFYSNSAAESKSRLRYVNITRNIFVSGLFCFYEHVHDVHKTSLHPCCLFYDLLATSACTVGLLTLKNVVNRRRRRLLAWREAASSRRRRRYERRARRLSRHY